MIRALAYRNGTRQFSAHIAAKNLIEVNEKYFFNLYTKINFKFIVNSFLR